jgi:hypothetical protein
MSDVNDALKAAGENKKEKVIEVLEGLRSEVQYK